MIQDWESWFSGMSQESLGRLMETIARVKKTGVIFHYLPMDQSTALTESRAGGGIFSDAIEVPFDKNGNRMQFCAQINFAELGGVDGCPPSGLLMLFLSRDYLSFRPKDQHWYRLIYLPDPLSVAPNSVAVQESARLQPVRIEYVPLNMTQDLLSAVQAQEKPLVEEWLRAGRESLHAADQLGGIESEKAREALIMAVFHSNGISFDQARRMDSCYKHLVDGSNDWTVFWKIGRLKQFPSEKRDLFICMSNQSLSEYDFGRCSPVFL